MYAVIQTGGKQYGVSVGETLAIEKIAGEVGSEIAFDEVLLISDGEQTRIGMPFLKGAKINIEILGETKAKKVLAFKKRRRHGSRVMKGHRQQYTQVRIKEIIVS